MISDFEIVEEKFLSLAEVVSMLEKIEEPTEKQKKSLKHAKTFSKLKKEDSENLRKELEDMELRKLKDKHIAKIINLLPGDIEGLKFVLEDSLTAFTDEELQKILDVVMKFK